MPAGDRHPFSYPKGTHSRRHTPPQYKNYQPFKRWLRDEFIFTCPYCLTRESWYCGHRNFGVDHFRPKSRDTNGLVDYKNLNYACNDCNAAKGNQELPDAINPEVKGWSDDLKIEEDGTISHLTRRGKAIIDWFQLKREELVKMRARHYRLYQRALAALPQEFARVDLMDFFGFPAPMPRLSARKGAVNPYGKRTGLPDWY